MAGEKLVQQALEAVRAKLAAGRALPEAERMIVTHNASPKAVEFYSNIGGLPAPSMGILKPSHGADHFGAVKMVGKPEVFAVPSPENPIFPNDAYTPRLGRGQRESLGFVAKEDKKSPLDLYTEWLRMNGTRGGETGTSGVGYFRALVSPEFKTLDEVQGARDRLLNQYDFAWPSQDAAENYSRLMYEIRSNAFNRTFNDKNLAEAADKGSGWLTNRWNVNPETAQRFDDFLARLKTMPTEYFEGKPQRSVKGEDFAGALVPEGEGALETAKNLEKLGVGDVKFYQPADGIYQNQQSQAEALFKHFPDQMFSHGGEIREHHADGERVRGSVNLDDVQFVSPDRYVAPTFDPRQIFEGGRRPMLPQDAGISGGGKAQTEGGELSTVSLSPGMNVGPLSAGPLLVGTKNLDVPVVGYRVGTQLPEGFSVDYSTAHPTNVPSKYSNDTLSLAKDILGMQVAAQLQSQGGKHGYGASLSKGDKDGQSYLSVQRPPQGGLSVMGGKEFRFADGGPVYQSTGEKLVDEGKINWGDPNEARDFFRADAERMRQEKAAEDASKAEEASRRTTGLPDGVTSYAPIGGGMTGGTPLLAAIRGQESSDDPNAQSKTSSAGGLFGFIDSTWANTLRRMNPELYGRMSDAELIALKKGKDTAALQQQAADYHLNQEILPTLNKAGIPATPGNAYLGWFQGAHGAVQANTLPQDARVADVFPKSVGPNADITFNGKPYAQWTLGDLRAWADAKMASRMKREHGGEVDDALRVVREHHAGGEEVGTQRQRTRAALDTLGSFEDKPPMDPAVMGENWANAVRRFRENPVREGEATMRPLELGARDVIGGMIAGDAPNTSYTTELRRRAADALVGSKGLPDSGTLGFGVADLPMVTGIPLQAADFAQSLKEGDYLGAGINAALPAAFYGRKPIAEAGRRALEIAREYAPKAAGVGTAAAVMSPEQAEAGKAKIVQNALNVARTFDHPISRTKLITPLEEMSPVFAQPKENITPRKPMDWSQMEGGVIIPATWDRTRGDRSILTEINGQKLTTPKVMEGGPLYMNWGDVQPERQIAASGQDIIKRMIDNAVEAKKAAGDKDVYLANVLMGLEGGDFSHMVADPLVDLARQRGFSKSETEIVDEAIRRAIMQNLPNKAPMERKIAYASQMPSIMDPDLERKIWEMGGGYRSSIAKAFDTAALKKMGVPDVASVRYAATQPELLNSPNLASGFSIAKVDPEASFVRSGHTTYPSGMAGLGYQGGSQVDIPFDLFWRDFMKTRPPAESGAHRQRAFTMQMPMQKVDPEWVDTISQYEQDVLRGIIPPR